jgi:hypothetical protein
MEYLGIDKTRGYKTYYEKQTNKFYYQINRNLFIEIKKIKFSKLEVKINN